MPVVSVIVPTFNRAHLVSQTIDSILAQTFDDWELILVDNESADDTEKVISSYQDERIRYFRNANHGVIAANRNYGIQKSAGEYIAFCDDDDLWMPDKLEIQLHQFSIDEKIGLVCTNALNYDDSGDRGRRIKAALSNNDFTFKSLINGNRVITSTVVLKTAIISDIGMIDTSPDLFTVEDYEFWLRIAGKYKIVYIDSPLIRFRTHTGIHTQKSSIEQGMISNAVFRKLLEKGLIDSDTYDEATKKRYRRARLSNLIRNQRMREFVSIVKGYAHNLTGRKS